MKKILSLLIIAIIVFASCGDDTRSRSLDELVILIGSESEPERLSPLLAVTSTENEVMEYMFLSLCDFDPSTNKMVPVLTTDVPDGVISTRADGSTVTTYSLTILPDAAWMDGTPITGHDFEFTMKNVFIPEIEATAWQGILSEIAEINVDEANPKQFDVVVEGDYFLSKEGFLTAEIYPAHVYDPAGLISDWTYEECREDGFFDSMNDEQNGKLEEYAKQFLDFKYSKTDIIEGSGPYRLSTWETGQYIILERKSDYWGSAYPDRTFLQSNPKQIIFQMVSDPTVAITQLKAGEADVCDLKKASAPALKELIEDPAFTDRYDMHYPKVPSVYYIMMNNTDRRLSDVSVRRALAHIMDAQRLVEQHEGGYGTVTNSVIPESKSYFNKNVGLVEHDIEKAKQLLSDAGWADTDDNGILDKIIDGKKEELSLRFFISGSAISSVISSVLANAASDAGVNIEVITKPFRATALENLIPGDYELFANRSVSEGDFDGYLFWHSSSTGQNGRNWMNYNNPKADELIMTIRTTKDQVVRHQAYLDLQEVMAEDQPVIFLYAPVNKIAVSKDFKPLISSKRPGYFANAFEIAE